MGVWIEITIKKNFDGAHFVTPFMGVWIEIDPTPGVVESAARHTLYGCVD